MENWRSAFYEAIRLYMREHSYYESKEVWDNRKVTSVYQNDSSPYYCETCGPDPVSVSVYYENSDGTTGIHEWYGDLGDLISGL